MQQIHLIVGARPNYIKAHPVYRALEQRNVARLTLVHTGQHYDRQMSDIFFEQLGMKKPDISLNVGSGSHGAQTAAILERYEKVLLQDRPDLVIVFGDVNSTVACSLAAVKLHIPVAHVEAGLRSFDRSMPEEINRVLTDQIADRLFITSPEAETHLRQEGIKPEKIHFVGNTMIDSLHEFTPAFAAATISEDLNLPSRFALLTFHRPSNVDDPAALSSLITALVEVATTIPCVFPVHPRTRQKLADFHLADTLEAHPNFYLIDPLGYIDFMALQKESAIVLTDSGGVQEETTCFGVPCLTVRDNTERPITCSAGTNTLIGTDYTRIPQAVRQTLAHPPKGQIPPLWDGKAGQRIADILSAYQP
ncbi:MAG: non-hydrolyzing UDP-N-acetylglucosamine 2-epimerase [Fidelibacterota bacterium]